MTKGGAEFPSKENDLQMQVIPFLFRKNFLEVFLCLLYGFAIGQTPTGRQAMNVGINRKCRYTKRLSHHDTGSLVTDPRKRFQTFKIGRDFPTVLFHKNAAQLIDSLGFSGGQSAGSNVFQNLLLRQPAHLFRRIRTLEESRGHQIDSSVRSLGREQDCNQQGERIRVIEWNRWIGIQFSQDPGDLLCLFQAFHDFSGN